MSGWIKIDNGMPEHPKLEAAGPTACWLYLSSIAYSNRNLTDGFVPRQTALRMADHEEHGEPMTMIRRLLEQGLWHEVEGGYMIHDYLDHQRSKLEISEIAEMRRDVGSRGGKASARARSKQKVKQTRSKVQAEEEEEQEQDQDLESSSNSLVEVLKSDVQTVYDHWRKARGRLRANYATISPGRRKKIESRLREFTLSELCLAIDGIALDPWDGRALQDDLTIVFRSREQVDKFLALADPPKMLDGGESVEAFRARMNDHIRQAKEDAWTNRVSPT